MALIFAARPVVTPFGTVTLPEVGLPPRFQPSAPDERARQILLQALGEDLAQIPGAIPVVGAPVEDFLEDTHHKEVLRLLTPEERERFEEFNKFLPSTLAVVRTLLFNRRP